MSEAKVNKKMVSDFMNDNGFIAHYRSFIAGLAPEGGLSSEHGRQAVIAFKKGSEVSLEELNKTYKENPKATLKLPQFKIVQYEDGPISDTMEMKVTTTVVSDPKDLWISIMGLDIETKEETEELMGCINDDYPVAKFLGHDKNDHEEYLTLYNKLVEFCTIVNTGKTVFKPLPDTPAMCVKDTTMSLTQYASKCGVPSDKMHMVEKYIDDWVAKASKTWDVIELKGNQITAAYYNTWGRTSCMAGANAVLCQMYARNPHAVSMFLVGPNITDKVNRNEVARVLVWYTANGDVVVDRPYHGNKTCTEGADTKKADAMVFAAIQARHPDKQIYTLYTGPNQKPKDKDDVVLVYIPASGLMPYLDTMLCVWSPQDDVGFLKANNLKMASIVAAAESVEDCSRIAYLASNSESIIKFITKILGKAPVGTPNIRHGRQQDGSPYATLTTDMARAFKSVNATTLPDLLKIPQPDDQTPPPCPLGLALKYTLKSAEGATEYSESAGMSSLMRQTLAPEMFRFLVDAPIGGGN